MIHGCDRAAPAYATNLLERQSARRAGDPPGVHTIYGEAWFSRRVPDLDAEPIMPLSIDTDPPGLPCTGAVEDDAGLRAMIAADAAAERAAQNPPRPGLAMR